MGYSFLTTQKQNEEIANAQRIALGIEYFGRDFCGWQHQVQACGIQDALEAALARVAGKPVATIAAGRTDAGVHATGQVVHFDTDVHRPVTAWVRGVNSHLPEGVAVLWAQPVTTEFHARFSALSRSYQYVLLNHMVRPGLHSGRVGWYHAPLKGERMQQAAELLLGEHDFSAFRAAECQAHSPVRQLHTLRISRRRDFILFELTANAFLHHMVRNVIGSLIWVGQGKRSPAWMAELLQSRDRHQAGPTASAAGLYLSHVTYAGHWSLPQTPSEFSGLFLG
jgi:tRNA pseudouridine38-40 synthase